MSEEIIYCPVCGRDIVAENWQQVESGEHEGYIFVHDDVDHDDSDFDALETGIQ